MKKYIAFTILLLVILPLISNAQIKNKGVPKTEIFLPKDYGADNQNWEIVQGANGLIYAGNNRGILEYDGITWRLIKTNSGGVVRNIAFDDKANIIYGGEEEFGIATIDSSGSYVCKDLTSIFSDKYRNFTRVRNIIYHNGNIFLHTRYHVLVIANNKVEEIKSRKNQFASISTINDTIYLVESNSAIFKFVNNQTIPIYEISETSILRNHYISEILPYNNDAFLLVSNKALFIYKNNTVTELVINDSNFKERFNIYTAVYLKNNHYALGTRGHGIIIINEEGTIVQWLNKENGLSDNIIYKLRFDSYGDLWACTNLGINRIEITSPFSFIGKSHALTGSSVIQVSPIYNNQLFVGANLGLYKTNWSDYHHPIYNPLKFSFIVGGNGQSWWSSIIGNNLYVANNFNIWKINDTKIIGTVGNAGLWNLIPFRNNPNLFIAGGDEMLYLYEKSDNTLKFKHNIKGYSGICRIIAEDNEGYWWVSNPYKKMYRFKFNKQLTQVVEVKEYNISHGLPDSLQNRPYYINGKLMVGTQVGFYEFDYENDNFYANETLNGLINNSQVNKIIQGFNNDIWFLNEATVNLIKYDSATTSPKLINLPFKQITEENPNNIFPIAENEVLISTDYGITHYNPELQEKAFEPNKTHIRKVEITSSNDSLIFNGALATNSVIPEYELKFTENNLRFNYSTAYYKNKSQVRYSWFLEGYDKQWSEWSLSTSKEYTNLPSGSFKFQVRALNDKDEISYSNSFIFTISTPWYKTILAYFIYAIILAIIIFRLVKIYTKSLKNANLRLETMINSRTEEIQAQRDSMKETNIELERYQNHLEEMIELRTKDLQKAKERAEQADSLKSKFLDNLSHEIRTPLNAIAGFSGLLRNDDNLSDTSTDYTYQIQVSTEKLIGIVDSIMTLSKLQTNQYEIINKEISINNLLNQIYIEFELSQSLQDKSKVNLLFDDETSKDLEIHSDENAIKTILFNLIDNSIKYTPEGNVEFGTFIKNNLLTFFVKDTGIGINNNDLNKIFEQFKKIDTDNSTLYGGLGIGLTISKRLANLLGGDLCAESEFGSGSTFYFSIPINQITKDK